MNKPESFFSALLDKLSNSLANKKGLLPLIGTVLIVLNLLFEILLPNAYFTQIDLFLHIGLVIAILGLVLARAL